MTTSHPNVLFVIADDHRHDAIAAAGNPQVKTPTLDSLIANGTHMRQAHIQGGRCPAVCVPTRASIHTGCGVYTSTQSYLCEDYSNTTILRPEKTYLAENFRQAGYQTFMTGKWHNCKDSFQRSFSDGDNIFMGGMGDHFNKKLHHYDPDGNYDNPYPTPKHSTEAFCDAACEFLERDQIGDQPFFLYLSFTSPHDPRTAPQDYHDSYPVQDITLPPNVIPEHPFDNGEITIRDEKLEAFPRTPESIQQHISDYYAMIEHHDQHLGRVIQTLKDRKLFENTIIVYVADHGLAVGQHGLLGKQNMYDHSIRVPLILAGPGIPSGQSLDDLVYSYDVHPTLLDVCGLKTPDSVEAKSFAPLISGQGVGRESVYSVYKDIQASVKQDEWKLIQYYIGSKGEGSERTQLFNVSSDPWEMSDLSKSPEHANKLSEMRELLHTWQDDIGDPLSPSAQVSQA